MNKFALGPIAAVLLLTGSAGAQQVKLNGRPVLSVATQLKPGEYLWEPQLSTDGPGLVIVNLETQRLALFRDGVPIAASTVSSGAPGHETPTGVFTILQKHQEHYSSTYNNAPMPNMQRLTWRSMPGSCRATPPRTAAFGCPTNSPSCCSGRPSLG